MLKNQLLITLRNMLKNKLYLFINIFGMGIAIACCIIGYFNYDFNASFDNNHTNASTLYRIGSVRKFQNELTEFGYVPIALGNAIKQNVKEVDEVIRYSPGGGNFRVKTELFGGDVNYVDPEFFKVFTFEFVEGNGDLKDRNEICISDELAIKYFGQDKALGKLITQVLDSGKTKEYVVAGVFKKQPSNSSFFGSAYSHYDNTFEFDNTPGYDENAWRFRNTLFVQIKDPSRVASIETQIKPYAENNNKIREDFIIDHFLVEPFEGMAVRDSYNDKNGTWTRDGSPLAAVIGIGMMGGFVLLIAIFNLTNTAVAISSRRLKEIGIRKVMGSTRKHLIIQFIGETALVCFLALAVGVLIEKLFLMPAFNKLWPDFNLTANYFGKPNFTIFLVLTLVFTSLLAGAYPAFYISKFQPVSILKGTLKFGGTNLFTRVLLCLQFAISLTGIVCSFAFTDNATFQRDFDMGFARKGIVFTNVNGRSEFETYRNALDGNPDIISITGTQAHLYRSGFNDPIKHEDKEIEVDIMDVSADYLAALDINLKEGRNFELDSETDRKESVIITEGLARKFGMTKPIGKEIIWLDSVRYYVVGVVQDIYNNGLWERMDPIMFRYASKENVNHILVKAPADKLVDVNKYMEAKWKEIFPDKMYEGNYMDEEMVEADTVNANLVKMFVFLGVVALMLSATGLFTLVSLNIIKKMKEIGVRKVLGASVGNLTKVINKEFIIILSIASVFGAALGWWMSAMLMESIWDYYQKVTITSMVISATILFVASALSIGYKIYKTTRLNPALVLRDE
ncbi:MAG TPA: ABC transporter permease [Cyclobacteriaceae bacterium]|nr:ABC transporter permease [Cyclobacteriaceae bacterium]